MKALITGFDPFGEHAFNPSLALLRRLRAAPPRDSFAHFAFAHLPTEFDTSRARLLAALDAEKPDIAIMFGLAATTPTIRLERVALNLDDAAIPDNAGKLRRGTPILPDAPLARMTDVDVNALRDKLDGHGFEVVVSNHAGAYVCNHVYYAALHHLATQPWATTAKSPQALFVHVPQMAEADIPRLETLAHALFRALARPSA